MAALDEPKVPSRPKVLAECGSLARSSAMLGSSVANQYQLRMPRPHWPSALSVEAQRGRGFGFDGVHCGEERIAFADSTG